MMKRMIVVAGLLVAFSGVSMADIADREHDDANTNTVLESVQATQDQIDGLIKLVETLQATCGEYQAPTVFRACRTVRGIKKCSRRTIEAVR